MSVEAPERIWVERDPDTGEKRWFSIKGMGDTEYVRADKLEELAAALRVAQGNTDAAIEDYNEAKAALAEKDKEIDWQRLCDVINAANRVSARTGKEHVTDANELREFALARNAGGNDAE